MPQGILKKFWPDRGYGFITADQGGDEIFVHAKSVIGGIKELVVGDRLAFNVGHGQKGPKALQVRVLKPQTTRPRPQTPDPRP